MGFWRHLQGGEPKGLAEGLHVGVRKGPSRTRRLRARATGRMGMRNGGGRGGEGFGQVSDGQRPFAWRCCMS